LNIFNFKHFTIMLDYAHNAAGLRALQKLVEKMDGSPKVGIIAGIGDRRDEDNRELGHIAAEMFDEVIIRQDRNLRGRTEEELIALVLEGVKRVDPNKKVTIIPKESDAITHAVTTAKPGTLIVVSSDVVPDALNLVMQFKEEESNRLYEITKDDIPNLHVEGEVQ
jgi:cyanophycin synthetase